MIQYQSLFLVVECRPARFHCIMTRLLYTLTKWVIYRGEGCEIRTPRVCVDT